MITPLVVDSREINEHPEINTLIHIPHTVQLLNSADYAFLDRNTEPTGIERCEIGNLMQKIRSGELESQLVKCGDDYSHIILLTEGVYDEFGGLVAHFKKSKEGRTYYRNRVENSFQFTEVKALEIRLSELGIETLWSPNFLCSMILVETIYKQRTKPEEEHTLFKKVRAINIPVKTSSNPAVPMLMSLVPRLPEKVAISLIYKYGSIWAILQAPQAELLEMKGFGKSLLDKLYKGVGKC